MTGLVWIIAMFGATVPNSAEIIYNETELHEKYPLVGEEYILFPEPNGSIICGYLKSNKSVEGFPLTSDEIEELGSTTATPGSEGGGACGGACDHPSEVKGIFTRGGVTFTLFRRKRRKGRKIRDVKDLKYIAKNKELVMVTHGWMSSGDSETCTKIKNNYLIASDVNVIIMDWEDIADDPLYPIAAEETRRVAKYCAEFVNYLVANIGVKHDDIHMIGHSLGAHVFGFCARHIENGKIGRISGLDPAKPGFEEIHLNTSDASFVFVIHTDADFLGMDKSIGHADFYPNCGVSPQPGCGSPMFLDFCSHAKSWELFVRSIRRPYPAICSSTPVITSLGTTVVAAIKCTSFAYTNCNDQMVMMGINTSPEARGSFYLITD